MVIGTTHTIITCDEDFIVYYDVGHAMVRFKNFSESVQVERMLKMCRLTVGIWGLRSVEIHNIHAFCHLDSMLYLTTATGIIFAFDMCIQADKLLQAIGGMKPYASFDLQGAVSNNMEVTHMSTLDGVRFVYLMSNKALVWYSVGDAKPRSFNFDARVDNMSLVDDVAICLRCSDMILVNLLSGQCSAIIHLDLQINAMLITPKFNCAWLLDTEGRLCRRA